jgi:hypothetical protein
MKIEELPSHIRTLWESAEVLNDEERVISTLLPIGREGSSSEALTQDAFIEQSIEQINRNSQGYYLAWEVARLVSDSLSWASEDEKSLLLDISISIKNRELAVQKNIPGNSSLLKDWENYQSLSHYLRAESVNDWLLKKGVGFRLPGGEPGHLHRPAGAPNEGHREGVRIEGIKVPSNQTPVSGVEDTFVEGIGSLIRPLSTEGKLPLNCELFELTDTGAAKWLAMDGWTLKEATILLCGANPTLLTEFAADPNVANPDFDSCGYAGIRDRLMRAAEMNVLTFPATPAAVCLWAARKQDIPPPLGPALSPVRGLELGALPRDEAEALRRCVAILAPLSTAYERRTMSLNVEKRIRGQDTGLLAFSFTQLAALSHPSDPGKARKLAEMLQSGATDKTFTTVLPLSERGALVTDLAGWPDCPPLSEDSPLRYWLPFMPKTALVQGVTTPTPEDWSVVEPPPVATGDVAHAFDGLRGWNEKAWKDNLGSPSKWLDACIAIRGQRGVRETRWNPVLIGAALVGRGHAKQNNIRARFQTRPQLQDWFEAWKTYEADNFDTQ